MHHHATATAPQLSAQDKKDIGARLYKKIERVVEEAANATAKANSAATAARMTPTEATALAKQTAEKEALTVMTTSASTIREAISACLRDVDNNEQDLEDILNDSYYSSAYILKLILSHKLYNTDIIKALLSFRKTTPLADTKRADAPAAPPAPAETKLSTTDSKPLVHLDLMTTYLEHPPGIRHKHGIFHTMFLRETFSPELFELLYKELQFDAVTSKKLMSGIISTMGYTPFLHVVSLYTQGKASVDLVKHFARMGSDPNAQDMFGNTTLHLVAQSEALSDPDKFQMLQWLVKEIKAELVENKANRSPHELVTYTGEASYEIVDFLQTSQIDNANLRTCNEIDAIRIITSAELKGLVVILESPIPKPLPANNKTLLAFITRFKKLASPVILDEKTAAPPTAELEAFKACLRAGATIDREFLQELIKELLTVDSGHRLQDLFRIILELDKATFDSDLFFRLLLSNKDFVAVAHQPLLLHWVKLYLTKFPTSPDLALVRVYSASCVACPPSERSKLVAVLFPAEQLGSALFFAIDNNLHTNYISALVEAYQASAANWPEVYSERCKTVGEAKSRELVKQIFANMSPEMRYQALHIAFVKKLHPHYIFALATIQQLPITDIKIFEYLVAQTGSQTALRVCLELDSVAHLLMPDNAHDRPERSLWDIANPESHGILQVFHYPGGLPDPKAKLKLEFHRKEIETNLTSRPYAYVENSEYPTFPEMLRPENQTSHPEAKALPIAIGSSIGENPLYQYFASAYRPTPAKQTPKPEQVHCGFIFKSVIEGARDVITADRDNYIPNNIQLLYTVELVRKKSVQRDGTSPVDKLVAAAIVKGKQLTNEHGKLLLSDTEALRMGLESFRREFVICLRDHGLAALRAHMHTSAATAAAGPVAKKSTAAGAPGAPPAKTTAAAAPGAPPAKASPMPGLRTTGTFSPAGSLTPSPSFSGVLPGMDGAIPLTTIRKKPT